MLALFNYVKEGGRVGVRWEQGGAGVRVELGWGLGWAGADMGRVGWGGVGGERHVCLIP